MFQYEKSNYIGRKIQLYPSDTISKWGVIEDIDDLGFTIKITKVNKTNYQCGFEEGDIRFINHSSNICFNFID